LQSARRFDACSNRSGRLAGTPPEHLVEARARHLNVNVDAIEAGPG
jgi:hypothetical protein